MIRTKVIAHKKLGKVGKVRQEGKRLFVIINLPSGLPHSAKIANDYANANYDADKFIKFSFAKIYNEMYPPKAAPHPEISKHDLSIDKEWMDE